MTQAPALQEKESGGVAARLIALTVLDDIFIRRRTLDEALAHTKEFETLETRDRAFVRLLVTIVLRRARQIDAALQRFLHEPLSDLKPANLINVFRLGFAQLAFLKTPDHAAVSTTVDLAEAAGIAHQKPLVNAVMRRLTREGFPKMDDRDAGKFNTPEWLWDAWMRDYGVEAALSIAAAHLHESPIDISVKSKPEEWVKRLSGTLLPTGSIRIAGGGMIPSLPGFDEGQWWVQNASAALPAKCFGDLAGKTVVDLCAAPGGKTAQLAAIGAAVIAVDRSAERMRILKENMTRLNLTAEIVIADGAQWLPKEPVDAVLLDAPCTATGTIRHQPDISHLKTLQDQEKLVALQKKLLLNACKMLKPGGTLVYSTCSLQKAEGEEQVAWLLSQNAMMKRKPLTPRDIHGVGDMLTHDGDIRALPFHWQATGGVDGFYVARLVYSPA